MSNSRMIVLEDNQGEDLFGNWLIQRRAELRRKEVLGFIERWTKKSAGLDVDLIGKEKEPKPTSGRNGKVWKAWRTKRDLAASIIVKSLDADQYVHIKGIDDDPLAMVEKLQNYHIVKGLGSLTSIYWKMMHTWKKDDVTIETHIKTICQHGDLLESLSELISPTLVIACILSSLPPSYKPIITSLNGDPQSGDITYVTARLQNFVAASSSSDDEDALNSAAALATCTPCNYPHRLLADITCFKCGKHGTSPHALRIKFSLVPL
ncbi:hypothetical protein BT96DRAFT_1089710 [Gymnopus androsaceus JB14]|uniref:Uncharacterized protein n=1 Tax=Gymnopus androsaceus JB14 TaxID=1447944 RepID=A0A6A4GJH0_9AGAR|nr:hypothetical protein BT96DRAFT_1089710 [Gymnopus androsaceus JB14]